jgi:hypothetical protein
VLFELLRATIRFAPALAAEVAIAEPRLDREQSFGTTLNLYPCLPWPSSPKRYGAVTYMSSPLLKRSCSQRWAGYLVEKSTVPRQKQRLGTPIGPSKKRRMRLTSGSRDLG